MKTEKKYQLHKISKTVDRSRYGLCGIHYDGKNAVATNGRSIAVVPCEPEEGDSDKVTVPTKFFAKASAKDNEWRTIKLNGRAGAGTMFSDYIDGNYPNYKQVMVDRSRYVEVVTLDAELLMALALAIGSKNKSGPASITLSVPKLTNGTPATDGLSPVLVTSRNSPEAVGIIMPIRG
jgi:DNA polymerase III sliding clamp (beta) subunit (PCNA family)